MKYINECGQLIPCNLSVKRSYFGINNFIVGLLEISTVNCIGLDRIRIGIGEKVDLDTPEFLLNIQVPVFPSRAKSSASLRKHNDEKIILFQSSSVQAEQDFQLKPCHFASRQPPPP